MIPLRLYSLILVVSGVVLAIYLLLRRKPKTADDLERERRQWLDQIGRITDGTVIDVQEMDSGQKPSTLLIYQYDVAGVSYEASQDVTYLRQWINLHSCRLGLPTSVRYDPHNPGNSIVVSEKWVGSPREAETQTNGLFTVSAPSTCLTPRSNCPDCAGRSGLTSAGPAGKNAG